MCSFSIQSPVTSTVSITGTLLIGCSLSTFIKDYDDDDDDDERYILLHWIGRYRVLYVKQNRQWRANGKQ